MTVKDALQVIFLAERNNFPRCLDIVNAEPRGNLLRCHADATY